MLHRFQPHNPSLMFHTMEGGRNRIMDHTIHLQKSSQIKAVIWLPQHPRLSIDVDLADVDLIHVAHLLVGLAKESIETLMLTFMIVPCVHTST